MGDPQGLVAQRVKILIDDERERLPDGSLPDLHARTWEAAVAIMDILDVVDDVWLDHDLGTEGGWTGYDWITLLETELRGAHTAFQLPDSITCVSDNPPGRARIEQVIANLYGGGR